MAREILSPHHRPDPLPPDPSTLSLHLGGEPSDPIAPALAVKLGFDQCGDRRLLRAQTVALAAAIGVIGAWRNAHHPAQHADRIMVALGIDEAISLYPFRPKISAAFFKMSRSISTSRSRFFSSMISRSLSEAFSTASFFYL
jgi:hypothetical protein